MRELHLLLALHLGEEGTEALGVGIFGAVDEPPSAEDTHQPPEARLLGVAHGARLALRVGLLDALLERARVEGKRAQLGAALEHLTQLELRVLNEAIEGNEQHARDCEGHRAARGSQRKHIRVAFAAQQQPAYSECRAERGEGESSTRGQAAHERDKAAARRRAYNTLAERLALIEGGVGRREEHESRWWLATARPACREVEHAVQRHEPELAGAQRRLLRARDWHVWQAPDTQRGRCHRLPRRGGADELGVLAPERVRRVDHGLGQEPEDTEAVGRGERRDHFGGDERHVLA